MPHQGYLRDRTGWWWCDCPQILYNTCGMQKWSPAMHWLRWLCEYTSNLNRLFFDIRVLHRQERKKAPDSLHLPVITLNRSGGRRKQKQRFHNFGYSRVVYRANTCVFPSASGSRLISAHACICCISRAYDRRHFVHLSFLPFRMGKYSLQPKERCLDKH